MTAEDTSEREVGMRGLAVSIKMRTFTESLPLSLSSIHVIIISIVLD